MMKMINLQKYGMFFIVLFLAAIFAACSSKPDGVQGAAGSNDPMPQQSIGDAAGPQELLVPQKYGTIEAALAAARDGDTITVDAGVYIPDSGRIVIDKGITLRTVPGLKTRPKIVTKHAEWTSCAIQIAADNVTIDGFEIDNSATGSPLSGYIIGDYMTAKNNWTVRNCDVHDGRDAIRAMGNNITIEHNDLHETSSDLINCEYGTCFGLKVRYNRLHSHHSDLGGKPAGVSYSCSASSGADVDISYNYCWATRTFIDFQNSGGLAPVNNILVAHNTVDFWIGDLPAAIDAKSTGQQMSIAWWTDDDVWNGPNFDIRDNIFSRQKWYCVVDTDIFMKGMVPLNNNLFWKWYLLDSWYPSNRQDKEWPAARGAVGWDNMGDGNGFAMTGCLNADPLFKGSGSTPEEYYSLVKKSPALGKASDGLNIGAWQGSTPVVIDRIDPDCKDPGKEVTIKGSGLTGVQKVYFGQVSAAITEKKQDNQIKATVPAGTEGSTVDVKVMTSGGTGILAKGFHYPLKGSCGNK